MNIILLNISIISKSSGFCQSFFILVLFIYYLVFKKNYLELAFIFLFFSFPFVYAYFYVALILCSFISFSQGNIHSIFIQKFFI